MPTDPFAILGVPRDATVLEIRAAYRREAMKHHPDRNLGDAGAHDRFKKVLRAYRAAVGRSRGRGAPSTPPLGPRPDRYGCGRCGDTFPFPEQCPRCDVALWDRSAGPAMVEERSDVAAFVRQLESRPVLDGPSWEERLPVPGLLVGGSLAAAAVAVQLGPLGPAALLLGFACYVTGLELHRRAITPVG